ncbi:MAG: OsmC family protein, partial [Pseudomonadota bacterium]
KPVIRKKAVSVSNKGNMKAVVDAGEYGTFVTDEPVAHGGTGEGPSPLQAVLGSLCGCESVTFNRTAAEFDFKYEGIEYEAMFTIDIRGRKGMRGVVPHFQTVRMQANVTTDETEERLAEVVEETEARCPVYNLLKDAGVKVETVWVRHSTSAAANA